LKIVENFENFPREKKMYLEREIFRMIRDRRLNSDKISRGRIDCFLVDLKIILKDFFRRKHSAFL